MPDVIRINELEMWTSIGVPESERKEAQRVLISVELSLQTAEAALQDDVSRSVDYEAVANRIGELGAVERKTLERLAEDIARMILDEFSPQQVQVTAQKFILPNTESVSVTIVRP